MAINYNKLVKLYQDSIDEFINNLGKNILVVYESTISSVSDSFNDPIRIDSVKQPDFKKTTTSSAPTVVENSETIKALITYNPKDFESFNLKLNDDANVIRLKTYITDIPKLKRCSYIIPNYDVEQLHQTKFSLLRAPIPRGIQQDRYAYTYWVSN